MDGCGLNSIREYRYTVWGKQFLAIVWLLLCLPASLCAADDVDIEITGAPEALAENIRARFGVVSLDEMNHSQFRIRANRLVREAVQALGYYHAAFELEISPSLLRVQLAPGSPVVWASPELEVSGGGADNPEILAALSVHPFAVGNPMNHGVYEDYKASLLKVTQSQGYPDSQFTEQRLVVDVNTSEARAVLHVSTGDRFRLGGIEFIGSLIDNDVLYQLLDLEVGVWYQHEMVGRLQRELMNSGYFRSVDVTPATDEERNLVTLKAQIRDEPKSRYSVGLGVASDTGLYTTLNWDKAVLNNRGHGLNINTRLSKPIQTVSSRYTIPWNHPREDYLEWVVAWQGKDRKDTVSYLTKTGINWRLDKRETKRSLGVNLEYEQYEQGSQPRKSTTYILPTASWVRLKIPTHNTNGYRYGIDMVGSSEHLGSDTDFLSTSVNGRYLHRFNETHSLLIRGEVGRIFANDVLEIPASKRFFAGGQDSVRGYSYESISPRDGQGALTGADRLEVGSVQYQYSFNRNWAVVAFVDSGRAYHNDSEPWRTGVGAGVRWSSPVGAVGLDIGFPVDDSEYSGYQVHFYLGPLI
jgi:translocation and assembly module TamA